MKILFVIDGLKKGGKERRFLELVENLNNRDDILFRIVLIHKDIEYSISDLTRSRLIFISKPKKKSFYPAFAIYQIAKRFQPDFVHTWSFMMTCYTLPTIILLRRRLINSQISNAPSNINRFSLFYILSRINFFFSSVVIANSYAGLNSYRLSTSRKAQVIYNGFDFKRLPSSSNKPEIRALFEISTPYVVAMVASFSAYKDYVTYIKAAVEILKCRSDITFLSVGDGPNLNYVKSLIDDVTINVKFLGNIFNVEELMAVCDVGVLSTYTEGISNSLLEFCASGVPIIATEGSGNEEIVKDGINGFLCKVKNPEDLAEKILRILEDLPLKRSMSKNAKLVAADKFSIDTMVNSYLYVYNNVAKLL